MKLRQLVTRAHEMVTLWEADPFFVKGEQPLEIQLAKAVCYFGNSFLEVQNIDWEIVNFAEGKKYWDKLKGDTDAIVQSPPG